MFDDQKGPVDIFAEVDKPGTPRPAAPVPQIVATSSGPSRLIPFLIVLVLLGGAGGGAYYFLAYSKKAPVQTPEPVTEQPAPKTETPAKVEPSAIVCGDNKCDATESTATCPADCPPPAPGPVCGDNKCEGVETTATCEADCPAPAPTQPITPPEPVPTATSDSDGDGLSDALEAELGTNPQSADTDNDALSDRDEVRIWHTNPLKPDTDGDGFLDGDEVKGGYNPNGPGKLFDVPKQ